MKAKVLVVDDEESIRFTFDLFLSENGHDVITAASYEEADDLIRRKDLDLIFADIVMDHKTGIDLLKVAKRVQPNTPVIMITGVPSIETATESLRAGALDYIIKPVCQDALLRVAEMALKHRTMALEKESCRLNFEAVFRNAKDGIVLIDDAMIITEINPSAARICGVRREEMVNRPVTALSDRCDGQCVDAVRAARARKSPVELHSIECGSTEKPDQVITLVVSPLLGPGDEFTGAVIVIRDETRLYKLERDLERQKSGGAADLNARIHKN